MGLTPTNPAKVSPKVLAASASSAVAVVIGWVLTLVPVVKDAPTEVHAAIVVLLVAVATFAAGYIKRDPARF